MQKYLLFLIIFLTCISIYLNNVFAQNSAFLEYQSIPSNGAYDWEFFSINNEKYLVLANAINGSSYNIDSKIYRWNDT